jgi:tetratricopeptide (TPR) repeat protein
MGFWFQVRTCIAALLGFLVALVGLALVLQLAALLLWQYGIALQKPSWPRLPIGLLFADHGKLAATALAPYLEYIPKLEWSWLANRADTSATHAVAVWLVDKVHIGLVPALLGVPLLLGGGKLLLRRISALAGARRYRADRLRRLGEYRRQGERLEPALESSGDRLEQRELQVEQLQQRIEQLEQRIEQRDRRLEPRDRVEARNDRHAYRREPFIGADG